MLNAKREKGKLRPWALPAQAGRQGLMTAELHHTQLTIQMGGGGWTKQTASCFFPRPPPHRRRHLRHCTAPSSSAPWTHHHCPIILAMQGTAKSLPHSHPGSRRPPPPPPPSPPTALYKPSQLPLSQAGLAVRRDTVEARVSSSMSWQKRRSWHPNWVAWHRWTNFFLA